jgi:hypothetical protein
MMGIEDNGPENAYPGPAEPGSDEDVYEAVDDGDDENGNQSDDIDIPENPPIDEAEELSPANSV